MTRLFRSLQFCASAVVSNFRIHSSMAQVKPAKKGLVLGIYDAVTDAKLVQEVQLTVAGKAYNATAGSKLISMLNKSDVIKEGACRVLFGLDEVFDAVAVVGLGKQGEGIVSSEGLHQGRETVRKAVAAAAIALRDVGVRDVKVDSCGYADAAAEGAFLSTFAFDELKSKADDRKPNVSLDLFEKCRSAEELNLWNNGSILARSQNIVRRLSDMPANLMTPSKFAELARSTLVSFSNVEVHVYDESWAEQKKMGAFLSVGKGSEEPSKFVEMRLRSSKPSKNPVCLVGKGVCFDSGGISLKPPANMAAMRSDMTGAACVLGVFNALAALKKELPFDVIGLTPLVENMPSGKANKPGDVVFAMNGKSIEVENTDAEGRLILADALCYADSFQPSHVIDIATLTGAMVVSLGFGATGVFSNCDELWQKMHNAGAYTGDRVWRLPLYKHYSDCIKLDSIDVCNTSKPAFKGMAGSCTAAAFLKEFTECKSWMHMDIAGVTENKMGQPLFNSIFTGRPLRTIVQCIQSL